MDAKTTNPITVSTDDQDLARAAARLRELNEQAWAMRNRDARQALELSHEAQALAEQLGDRPGLAYALFNTGVCRWVLDEFPAALDYLNQALILMRELEDVRGQASTINWIGNCHWRLGDYRHSLECHFEALRLRTELDDVLGQAGSLNNIGLNYFDMAQYAESLDFHLRSLQLYEASSDNDGISTAVNNLATLYEKLGDYDKALEYNFRSLAIVQEEGYRLGEINSLLNIGSIYRRQRDFDHAIEYHTRCLEMAREINSRINEAYTLVFLGDVYLDLGKHQEALQNFLSGAQIFRELTSRYDEHETLLKIASALRQSGAPEKSLPYLHDVLSWAEAAQSNELLYQAHQSLSEAFEKLDDPAAALQHLKAGYRIREAVFGDEAERKIKTLLIKSEVEKAQREAEIYRLKHIELARAYEELQRADEQKAELLEKLRHQAELLERQTFEDDLTGIANRRYLESRLAHEFKRARRFQHDLTVAMVDIDNFKNVNDQFSHRVGDEVLKIIARLFKAGLRAIDTVGRYGGEEFLLILVETPPERAYTLCERLRETIASYDWTSLQPGMGPVTVSMGVYGDPNAPDPSTLVYGADVRLYQAKRRGKNRVCVED